MTSSLDNPIHVVDHFSHGTVLEFDRRLPCGSQLVCQVMEYGETVESNIRHQFLPWEFRSVIGWQGKIALTPPQVSMPDPKPGDILVVYRVPIEIWHEHQQYEWTFATLLAQAELIASPLSAYLPVIYRLIYRFKSVNDQDWGENQELWRGEDPDEAFPHLHANYGDGNLSSLSLHYRDFNTEFWYESSTDTGATWTKCPSPKRSVRVYPTPPTPAFW